jgi:hypothetical protein
VRPRKGAATNELEQLGDVEPEGLSHAVSPALKNMENPKVPGYQSEEVLLTSVLSITLAIITSTTVPVPAPAEVPEYQLRTLKGRTMVGGSGPERTAEQRRSLHLYEQVVLLYCDSACGVYEGWIC